MDSKSEELFYGLRQKIRTIVSLYEDQKNKNKVLTEKNIQLTEKVNELENKLEELNKKYENIKIAKVLSSIPGEDIHDAKLQVNRIVREIDKCIALLNQ